MISIIALRYNRDSRFIEKLNFYLMNGEKSKILNPSIKMQYGNTRWLLSILDEVVAKPPDFWNFQKKSCIELTTLQFKVVDPGKNTSILGVVPFFHFRGSFKQIHMKHIGSRSTIHWRKLECKSFPFRIFCYKKRIYFR